MKFDEKKLINKIIQLATPMLTTENLDSNLVRINATAIVSLCEVLVPDENTGASPHELRYPSDANIPNNTFNYMDVASGDTGTSEIFERAREEQKID